MARARSNPSAVRTTVARLGWPLVLLMLVAAVVTVAAAVVQSTATDRLLLKRDRGDATGAATFIARYLDRRTADQANFIASNATVFRAGSRTALQKLVEHSYLANAPGYVVGAVVTDQRGDVAIATARQTGMLDEPATLDEVASIARQAAGRDRPVTSGRLDVAHRLLYAQAIPLGTTSARYGAWVVIHDLAVSPVGGYSQTGSGVEVVDDHGGLLSGHRLGTHRTIDRTVRGTTWRVQVARTTPPASVPTWLLVALVLGVVLLGGLYWLQEGTRRALAEDADASLDQARRLHRMASDLLHAESSREQAALLAANALEATRVDAVRVLIAADRDPHGILVGDLPEGGSAAARRYHCAIVGPRLAIGELVLYQAHDRIDEDQRSVARTMAVIAGAAVHTFSVLERERETAVELQRIDELRTNLLSTVAHELRSPLTAVKGVLGLLSMQDDLSDKQREYVEVATTRTDALVALIRDLFDCSLLESGQLDIRPERVLATDLLDSALGAAAAASPGELVLSATPNLKVTVDPLRFDQIVNNLVTNALRHGAPPVEVELRPYRDGACLVVSDSGPGIPRSERHRIFSKFYQSDSGHARLVEGAGLGLALVHGLVHLHGGRIEVDSVSADGRGARFTIFLPDVVVTPADRTPPRGTSDAMLLDVPDTGFEDLREII